MITTTINMFERVEGHLLPLENTIVIELLPRLLVVELALEKANLIIECLKLVIEGAS